MTKFGGVFIIFGCLLHTSYSTSNSTSKSREHKIHNIVLYPDKHSWCTTTAIVQVVGHPGCNSVKIDNNVCVGACFSYIVPKTIPETPGDVLPYCDSCQPDRVSWKKVDLQCTEENKNQNLTKYVQLIHACTCGTCSNQLAPQTTFINADTSADKSSSEADLVDGPAPYNYNETSDTITVGINSSEAGNFKTVLSGLLKTLNNEDENILEDSETKGLHKNVWKRLLDKVEAMNSSSIDTNSLTQLIKSVEEELKVKFNYKRLKQALLKFKKYQVVTKEQHTKENNISQSQLPPQISSTTSNDHLSSGQNSKQLLPPKILQPIVAEVTASPSINVSLAHVRPTTTSNVSEISYQEIKANNSQRIVEKKEKFDPLTNFTVAETFNRTS